MAPSFEFPAPVLCVATDVVRQLEGGEALTGLWTLFTKCKASLEDGHRLENISWRLWHRELAATTPRPGRVSGSEHSGDGNQMLDAKTAIGYEQGGNFPKTEHLPSTHVPLPPYPIHSSVPRAHLQSPMVTTAGSLTRCNGNSFGKIIIDMLPNPLPSATPHPCKDPAQTGSPLTSSVSPQSSAPAPTADTHSLPIHCHLPTPAASEHYPMPPSTVPAQTSPEAVPLFQVQVQVDPAPPSNPPPPLPQLIIVHPTPGPTPHPTPPASPILAFGASSGTSKAIDAPFPVAAAAAAEQLASPKFTLHADTSTTSSSSDSSSTSGRITTLSLSATTISVNEESEAVAPPQTKHAASAAVAVSLANGSRASSIHVVAPPPLSGTTTTVLTKPTPTPTPAASVVKKAHSSPTVRPSPAPAPAAAAAADAEHSRARPRASGSLRQASSASSVVGSPKGGDERSKSKSRSRSRGRADGPGRAGLMMTAAGGKRGSAMAAAAAGGGAQRGRAVGLRKSVSGKGGGSMGRAVVRDKKPTFNIGSNSDGGSKSVGSGSSVSNTVNVDVDGDAARREEEGKMGKTKTSVVAPQRQQSASKLMPPPLRHLLPDPATVLPSRQQQPRRTIVLATSDSDDDYETETDVTESDSEHGGDGGQRVEVEEEGDNADWSSEDMSNDDVEFVRRGGGTQPRSGGHDKKGHVQPQHRSNSTANIPSTHHNHNHNHNHNHANSNSTINNNRQRGAAHPHHLSRAQQSRRNHAANAQYVVEQAALEAERIRDMFAKKPVPSSEDLVKQRTNSVGLLTQLMHPDPEIFPPSHPYHRGHSSGDVKGTPRGLGLLGGGLEMTRANSNANANVNVKVNGNEVGARAAAAVAVGQGQAGARGKKPGVQPPQRRASAGPVPGINLRKSAVATPVASQVQVGSVSSVSREPGEESARADDGEKSRRRGGVNGVYRPKGRPADQEMEDTESEGENGDASNEILVSKSVAQEKLKALAARKGIVLNQRREEEEEEGDPMPSWARESALEAKGRRRTSSNHPSHGDAPMSRQQQQSQVPVPTPTPIPLGHPYNLPPAAPPSTPRTTRRLMLQTEMSESLRRNLLWERQVSKVNLVVRRSSSGSGSSRNGTVLGGAPLRPLTGLPSLVQLTAKQPGSGTGSGSNTPSRERGAASEEQDREERKMRALARTRSWANEFHYTGW